MKLEIALAFPELASLKGWREVLMIDLIFDYTRKNGRNP